MRAIQPFLPVEGFVANGRLPGRSTFASEGLLSSASPAKINAYGVCSIGVGRDELRDFAAVSYKDQYLLTFSSCPGLIGFLLDGRPTSNEGAHGKSSEEAEGQEGQAG